MSILILGLLLFLGGHSVRILTSPSGTIFVLENGARNPTLP